jgi:predicted enzyme related to lactoylglutathione lyase
MPDKNQRDKSQPDPNQPDTNPPGKNQPGKNQPGKNQPGKNPPAANPSAVYFENSQPILRVESMQASLRFYVDLLGFENAEWGTDEFTSISRGRAGIYLCRGGQGRGGAWVWIGVEDAAKLHEEYQARGVAIRMPPTNFPWALEMQVEDPDGNVLRFGSEPL